MEDRRDFEAPVTLLTHLDPISVYNDVYVRHRHIHAEPDATAQIRHDRTEYRDGPMAAQCSE